jgi:1-deoxy-D-xylulose-5-phosphate reductoisomerase
MKNISILGSTGSIGTQALQVVDFHRDQLNVVGLAAGSNVELLEQQIEQFDPDVVALADEASAELLKKRITGKRVEVLSGGDQIGQTHRTGKQGISGHCRFYRYAGRR